MGVTTMSLPQENGGVASVDAIYLLIHPSIFRNAYINAVKGHEEAETFLRFNTETNKPRLEVT